MLSAMRRLSILQIFQESMNPLKIWNVEETVLSLVNLHYFHQNIPWLDEVSIGHALICDALYMGLHNTIQAYLECLK